MLIEDPARAERMGAAGRRHGRSSGSRSTRSASAWRKSSGARASVPVAARRVAQREASRAGASPPAEGGARVVWRATAEQGPAAIAPPEPPSTKRSRNAWCWHRRRRAVLQPAARRNVLSGRAPPPARETDSAGAAHRNRVAGRMRDIVRQCLAMLPPAQRRRWLLIPLLGMATGAAEAGAAAAVFGLISVISDPQALTRTAAGAWIAAHLPRQGGDAVIVAAHAAGGALPRRQEPAPRRRAAPAPSHRRRVERRRSPARCCTAICWRPTRSTSGAIRRS